MVTDHRTTLSMQEKYIRDLYHLENRPKILQLNQKRNWIKMTKGPTILKTGTVKAIKRCEERSATGDDNILDDLLKELGDSGLKIMTALINKIYMSGDWPKGFLDALIIALPNKNQAKNAVTTEQLASFHTLERLFHVSQVKDWKAK